MTLGIANVEEPHRSGRSAPQGTQWSRRPGSGGVSRLRTSYRDDGVRIAAHGPSASDELHDVPAAAVTAALQTLYGFFVEHYAEIVAMPSSFASVKQRLAVGRRAVRADQHRAQQDGGPDQPGEVGRGTRRPGGRLLPARLRLPRDGE